MRHGVDLVHVTRLREVMESNPAFEAAVFTEGERAYCRRRGDPWPHFAARFAAKEALLKAFHRGLSATGIDDALREVEVVRESGAPRLELHGGVARLSRRLGAGPATVSLTHSGDLALASVLVPDAPAAGGAS